MTFSFLVRLFFVSLIRFIGLIVLLLWHQNFEVSPLPAWTLDAVYLLAVFGWTFLATRWALRKSYPTHKMMGVLVGVFLIGQVILELWLTKRLTGTTWAATIKGAFQWGALLQIAIHLGGISLGYWRTKKLKLMEHAPDEVHIAGTN